MGLESDLPEFKSGGDFFEEITAARLNAMVKAINAGRLRRGKGYRLKPHGDSGVSLEIETPRSKKSATFTVTLDGTETVPNGGFFRTFQIHDTGLPDGTPVSVDYSGQGYPVVLAGSSVIGGTITLDYWHAEGNVIPPFTMGAGTITVRAIL